MPSQKTLIWAAAATATLVVAGAGAGALVWTTGFVWPGSGSTPVEARAPERPTPSPRRQPAGGQVAAPPAADEAAAAPGVKPAPGAEAAAANAPPPGVKPTFES